MEPHTEQLRIQVEVAKGGFVKRRPDRSIDFVSPLPCPFNYGSVVGREAPDGDPEDALILGEKIAVGETIQMPVWGRVKFVDAGVEDHKWVCGVQEPTEDQWAKVRFFFQSYVWAKRVLYLVRPISGRVEYLGIERFTVEDCKSR